MPPRLAPDSGGSTPVTGFHSTIESPDSVSRVAPPTSTIATIIAATTMSHARTPRGRGALETALSAGVGDVFKDAMP